MTVMFPPATRLARTRVAVTAVVGQDLIGWKDRVTSLVGAGAGYIVAVAATPKGQLLGDALSAARRVSSRVLIGAAEPLAPETLADAIQVTTPAHLGLWPGRLVGCPVANRSDLDACLALGADYVVVDAGDRPLVEAVARQGARTGLVWFASGVQATDDLADLVRLGVRRLWAGDASQTVAAWSQHLREVWHDDPGMRQAIITSMRRDI